MVKRAAVVLVLACGVAAWWRAQSPSPAPQVASQGGPKSPGLMPANAAQVSAAARAALAKPMGGSPAAWSVVGGQLVPGRALRDRFDSYLPLGRGVTMVEVRAALQQDALAAVGPANGAKVLALWDRYARLQTHEWKAPFNEAEPRSWPATLDEQRAVRRQLLGPDWARAFFADDELALQRRLTQALAVRRPAKPSLEDVLARAAPGAGKATAKMASAEVGGRQAEPTQAQAADADWRRRSEASKQEWSRLEEDASLDEGQRLLRMRHYLQLNFTPAEVARLEAELRLP
ncbi:MAG: hypothetical protein EOP38_22170 [Rubrivivax sp.]|nr:MAG: hypothetical protein EOP38_22170 [Rubrivivax sp.]